jgi:hypothetical protein
MLPSLSSPPGEDTPKETSEPKPAKNTMNEQEKEKPADSESEKRRAIIPQRKTPTKLSSRKRVKSFDNDHSRH